ncbi:GNAT family N-acetyltransferase [Nocardioides nitrophenolicus]|uniref:GNAT family N-acetyltransferase n=1 Tax=Nocardioides nitrophenolicus TaxID=60489 RepID=UPI00195CE3AC|nr:GNAT family N-acetyltransferase [Nocardioides nitrophenolicus]MBM7517320.1 putative acetyltransferase [Nocardioides nitrophenolicus]
MSPEIRAPRPDESEAALRVVADAFGAEGAAVAGLWRDVVSRGLDRAQLVAVAPDGAVVGHVGLSHGWLDTRPRLLDLLVLSPLSVAPAHQAGGIGTTLLRAAVAEADRLGAPLVVLEGDPGYYGRRGWVPAADLDIEAPTHRVPGPAFQAVPLATYESWMRGRVVYREVWWEHDSAGLRDPLLAQVEAALERGRPAETPAAP